RRRGVLERPLARTAAPHRGEQPATGARLHLSVRRGRAAPCAALGGRRAHRCAVHRHRDLPAPSRRALAPQAVGPRRHGGAPARDLARRVHDRRAGWPARVQHLFPRDRRERRAGRALPVGPPGVASRAAGGGFGARCGARRGSTARASAASWYGRIVRGASPESGVSWRGRLRRLIPYVIALMGGFLLAYLVVAFFVFPAGIIPQDVRVPNVIGLSFSDADQQLKAKGFSAERGETRYHNAAPKGTVL